MIADPRIAAVLLALLAAGCSRAPAPAAKQQDAPDAELRKAEAAARHLTSSRHLKRSACGPYAAKPSELVSCLFSSIGVAEWPPGEEGSEMQKEQSRSTRTPLMPKDASLVHHDADPRLGRQLVLRGDDASREILATGYINPANPPAYTTRWPAP